MRLGFNGNGIEREGFGGERKRVKERGEQRSGHGLLSVHFTFTQLLVPLCSITRSCCYL